MRFHCAIFYWYEVTSICNNVASEVGQKVVLLSENKQPIGLGQVINGQADVHLQAIPYGYCKVMIDYVVPGTRPYLKNPFDDDDLQAGQFTVWPKTLTKSAYSQ